MDGLHLASSPSVNAFRTDRSKAREGSQSDIPYSITAYTTRSLPGSTVQHQAQNKGPGNKVTTSNEFFGYSSSRSSITCSDSYDLVPKGCHGNNSSDVYIDSSRINKDVKKSLRKKTRRKGKQNKKVASHTGLTETEVSSDYAHGSSTSETCGCNDHGDKLVSYATSRELSLPDGSINKIECQYDRLNHSGVPKSCTFNNEFDMVETTISSMLQNFPVEHQVANLDIGIQVKDQGITETHIQINYDDMLSNGFSKMPSSLMLDSVSVGSSSDDSINANHDIKPFDKESRRVCFSKSPVFSFRKGIFNGVIDPYNHAKGTKHGIRNFSSSDVHLLVPGKRGKQIKIWPRNSNVYKFGNGRTGKENNYSVWQKVQRNDADDCNEFKKVPMCSQFNIALKEAPLLKRNCNVPVKNTSSGPEDKKQPKTKALKKLKRKGTPGSKQVYDSYNGRGTHSSKASLNTRAKTNMQQNEMLDNSAQVGVKCISKPCNQNGSPRTGFYNNRVECVNSGSIDISQVFPDGLQLLESTFNSFSDIKNHHTGNKDNSRPKLEDFSDQSLSNVEPPAYLPHLLGSKISQTENEFTPLECSKKNHSSVSTLQKWIPIGVKVPGLTSFGSSSADHFDQPVEDWTLGDTAEEKVAFNSKDLVSSLTLGMDKNSGNASCFSHEDNSIQMLKNLKDCMLDYNGNHVMANCLISKSKDENCSAFEVESNKIVQAVNDAYRTQLASEAVQMAIGGPIAEFERVLHFSSPVICQSPSSLSCQTCLQDQFVDASLCRHETLNISLGCLWQWYEKHGSYGLEIKAEDYENSRRLGVDRFTYRAYFVPYLSAVQLFKTHESKYTSNSNKVPASGLVETCEISETLDNCNIGHLPIFSVLVPQPRTRDSSQSVDMTFSNDTELLFEYFESDQPQRRQPLFEKIQELVRGDGPTQQKMYGDPTNLVTVNLHDLHPRSWYSVAWYPIYRIPDGNFRAAFLTYHSLSHFVHRGTNFNSPSVDACVVSPVMGLLSYNAQDESWFQLRQNAVSQTTEIPSRIFKERLRTLEEAASLMSTAVVNKGSETSVNKHPDYEFFLSRRSY